MVRLPRTGAKRAVRAMERSTLPKFYFDLRKALASWGSADTPWTPAVSLVLGVDAALGMIRDEGIENVWRRHERLAFGTGPGFDRGGVWFAGEREAVRGRCGRARRRRAMLSPR